MCFDHKKSLYFSVLLFVILLFAGYLLSQRKAIWNDEYFTQQVSVDNVSYSDIMTGQFADGNRCPLFYIFQNIVSDMFAFKLPLVNFKGSHLLLDQRSQIITRIPSNIYMSLALAGMFYFFLRFFSLSAACYALLVAFISPMVWLYWVEARPYSLWFLLTMAQLLLYCSTILSPKIKINKPIYLTHFLLVLTTPGGIFQVLIISLMLFLKKRLKAYQLILATLIPTIIFLIYYFLVPIFRIKTFFFFTILFEAVMPEHLLVYLIYAIAAWVLREKRKESSSNTFFLPIFLLFLLSGLFVLITHLYTRNFQFGLFNRYLVYLAPADILMFTLAGIDLWRWSKKNIWVCTNLSILLGGLIIIRGLLTYREIWSTALYLHSPG
jgi:hypothetical protein